MTITGPNDNIWHNQGQFDAASAVWSQCGTEGLLNINSEVRLPPVGTNTTALLSVEALQHVGLMWRRCGPAAPTPEPSGSLGQ